MSAKTSKVSKKQELSEKVQEIQKRQQNWLKQRNDHKKKHTSVNPDTKTSTASCPDKTTNSTLSESSKRNKYNTEYSVEKTTTIQSKDKFQSWMETRENAEKLMETKNNASDEPDVLKISSTRAPGYATPDPDWDPLAHYSSHGRIHGQSNHGIDAAKSIMSHQDFDDMANKIVARVKNELDIPYKSHSKVSDNFSEYKKSRESCDRTKRDQEQNDLIASHFCVECKTLMMSSEHVPMILTPCAHSMCQSCCQGRSLCPQCACTILSKTCNIMLLQIIQNHHKSREKTAENQQRQTYSPDNYREKAKTKQQHLDEYENLQTRQEVLRIESREIQGHMSKLANKIEQQRQQQQNIEREEKKVRDKIQSLKEKLVELESHKKGYDREIDDIELERTKDKNKLNMVQDTLSSIEIEMEKLRIQIDGR
ncbi:E3 ubiquitin-protein ligase CHFR-like [Mytilus trossulus]|uniref:E3 ubiquitin-protein ligase CHFR-like n=1 Tax=Mytilus trossulus TaxID=6551 RepID=UPI003007ABFF